jgi:glycosyltransferase involved in cell wall biosynthesis
MTPRYAQDLRIDSHKGLVGPKVTIITACRNAGPTIEETILSVVNQTYRNVEYIIIDADSEDETRDIIDRHKDFVSIWIREKDAGLYDAWNKGIRNATGEYIGLINADDFYVPTAVESVVRTFEQDKLVGFVYGNLKVINKDSAYWHIEEGRPDYMQATRFDMLHVPHPTVFVRKVIYDQVGPFDTMYRIASDYEFIRRMATRGIRGSYVPETLAIMRQGGISHTNRIAAFKEVRRISVANGCGHTTAAAVYYFKYVRTFLGMSLDRLGVDAIWRRRMRDVMRRVRKSTNE